MGRSEGQRDSEAKYACPAYADHVKAVREELGKDVTRWLFGEDPAEVKPEGGTEAINPTTRGDRFQ